MFTNALIIIVGVTVAIILIISSITITITETLVHDDGYRGDSSGGWQVGMPYDSYARQMISENNRSTMASAQSPSSPVAVEPTPIVLAQPTISPMVVTIPKVQQEMIMGPDVSYQLAYGDLNRSPARYGYGTGSIRGPGWYSQDHPQGQECKFPFILDGTKSKYGPAGPFTLKGSSQTSQNNKDFYNLAIGVL